jgi:LPS export ABC transporter protein LptC
MSKIDTLFSTDGKYDERAMNIKSVYSDSARLYFTMESPEMVSIRNNREQYLEYPRGIKINFLDEKSTPSSWLVADSAVDDLNSGTFTLKGNVMLFNKNEDKLQTSELIWDSGAEIFYTNKFVRITQPEKGDTLYGFGFSSNSAFTEFEIRRKFSGKVIEAMVSDFY